MSQRHPIQNEATMFITTNVMNRRPIFSDPAYAKEAIDLLYRLQSLHLYHLYGFVIMPDHCHFLVRFLPPYTLSKFMSAYKAGLTFDIGIGAFWQENFDLRLPKDCWKVLNYIHQNPVKAGLVKKAEEYPWSSAFGRYDVSSLHSLEDLFTRSNQI